MIKLVIFDMDGLMIDSERPKAKLFVDIFAEHGIILDPDYVTSTYGINRKYVQAQLHEMYPDADVDEYLAEKTRRTRQYFDEHGVPIKTGLFELFEKIENLGILKAVATSTDKPRAMPLLEESHIDKHMDGFVFSDEIKNGKPAPDIFLTSAEKLGIAPSECLVLEDSIPGIHAAHAAGMKVICIPDLKNPDDEARAMCEAVYPTLLDVIGYLDKNSK